MDNCRPRECNMSGVTVKLESLDYQKRHAPPLLDSLAMSVSHHSLPLPAC